MGQLLVASPYFADDIEIRPVGLEHEKFPHMNCRLKNNVIGDDYPRSQHATACQRFIRIAS
jgi:hypothetical protein